MCLYLMGHAILRGRKIFVTKHEICCISKDYAIDWCVIRVSIFNVFHNLITDSTVFTKPKLIGGATYNVC
jgi:hypothetical protein